MTAATPVAVPMVRCGATVLAAVVALVLAAGPACRGPGAEAAPTRAPDAVECAALGAVLEQFDPRLGPLMLLDSAASAAPHTPAAAAGEYAWLRRTLPRLAPSTWASFLARNARPSAGCAPHTTHRGLVLRPGRRGDLDTFGADPVVADTPAPNPSGADPVASAPPRRRSGGGRPSGGAMRLSGLLTPNGAPSTGPPPRPPDVVDAFWAGFRARYPGARGYLEASRVGVSADGRQALVWLDFACGEVCGRGAFVLLERGPFGPLSRWAVVAGAVRVVS